MQPFHTFLRRGDTPHRDRSRSAHHAQRLGMLAVLTVAAMSILPAESAGLQPPVVSSDSQTISAPQRSTTASVRLRNTSSDTLRIEIRVGPGSTCDDARNVDIRALPPGRSWLIAANHPICWRQAPDGPVAMARWASWERRALLPSQRVEVALSAR